MAIERIRADENGYMCINDLIGIDRKSILSWLDTQKTKDLKRALSLQTGIKYGDLIHIPIDTMTRWLHPQLALDFTKRYNKPLYLELCAELSQGSKPMSNYTQEIKEKVWDILESRKDIAPYFNRSRVELPDDPVSPTKKDRLKSAYVNHKGVKWFCNPSTDFWSVAPSTPNKEDYLLWVEFVGFHGSGRWVNDCLEILNIIKSIVGMSQPSETKQDDAVKSWQELARLIKAGINDVTNYLSNHNQFTLRDFLIANKCQTDAATQRSAGQLLRCLGYEPKQIRVNGVRVQHWLKVAAK